MLPTIFSYKRWKFKKENITVGDLVMLKYPGQFKDDYCVAKVIKAEPDKDGLVRKVVVAFKKRNPRESKMIYKSKPLLHEEVAVHRLQKLHLADGPALLGDNAVMQGNREEDDQVAADLLEEGEGDGLQGSAESENG